MTTQTERRIGQLCWLFPKEDYGREDKQKILHWRDDRVSEWKPYREHPQKQADYTIPDSSLGMATAQYLLRSGEQRWEYVSSDRVVGDLPIVGSDYLCELTGGKIEVWSIADLEGDRLVVFSSRQLHKYDYAVSSVKPFRCSKVGSLIDGDRPTIAWAIDLSTWMTPIEVEGNMRDRFSKLL